MGPDRRRIFLTENHEITKYNGHTQGEFAQVLKTAERITGIPAAICLGEYTPMWWIASYRTSFQQYSMYWDQFLPIGPFDSAAEAAVWLKLIADREDARH